MRSIYGFQIFKMSALNLEKCIRILFVFLCSPFLALVRSYSLHTHDQFNFILRWKESNKTIYDGKSVRELLDLCPNGCGPGCMDFPAYSRGSTPASREPCTSDDIKVLRKAQQLAEGWMILIEKTPLEVFAHSFLLLIITILILILVCKGHYRFRDLWFLPSNRQWELERDPTWGLPGKVWGLLQMRVVKNENADAKPTDRKYASYTENPTTLGDRFWYYKQALRDIYKTHKYYKRNRLFHKLAWQFTKLGKLVPETLRRQKTARRRAGELEELRSNPSSEENDPQENMPWEIDLADEVNQEVLRTAKETLLEEVEKQKRAGRFVVGRYQSHQHHHHHHHATQVIIPLTRDEVESTAKNLEVDPNADCFNVDGIMRRHPAAAAASKQTETHHHRHHHRHLQQQPSQQQQQQQQPRKETGTGQRLTTSSLRQRQ